MIDKPSGRKKWRLARWRIWVQLGFLLAWLEPLPLQWHGLCAPVFHCYSCPLATLSCPIGILANYSVLHAVPLLTIGILLMVGAVFGSLVCGWACPFGLLQDLLARTPLPKFRLPGVLGWTRYAVLLGLVLVLPYFFGDGRWFFICRLCPAGALEASVPNSVQQSLAGHGIVWLTWTKAAILVVFVGASLLVWRPWCTLFCPLGAFFSACNYISLTFLRFQPARCNNCDICRDLCKYHGPSERRGSDLRCIRCLECANCRALSVGTVFHKRHEAADVIQLTRRPPGAGD